MIKSLSLYLVYIILIGSAICSSFGQSITNDGKVEFDLLGGYIFDSEEFEGCFIIYPKPEDYIHYKVECVIKSVVQDEPIDVNMYSLVDETNKLRYRPVCVSSNYPRKKPKMVRKTLTSYLKLTKEDCFSKVFGPNPGYAYKPEYQDSFSDYTFEGYKVCEVELPYKIRGEEGVTTYYFKPKKYDALRISFSFALPKIHQSANFKLYYGDQLLSDLPMESLK